MKEALYYTKQDETHIKCLLCPHECILTEGKRGICKVRKSVKNTLISENYGLLSSVGFDPIEKKPLYHFFPGKEILSIGSVGCNLSCYFCQNCEISQTGVEEAHFLKEYPIHTLIEAARGRKSNIGIAYTYNEPTVFYEYMIEVAREIKKRGLHNVIVSNGFINPEPLEELLDVIDACNIDLKAFTDEFYKRETKSGLQPVLETLKHIKRRDRHLEVTNLVIPGKNDDEKVFKDMISWIFSELGKDTPLHLSRYFPRYKATEAPTSEKLLARFYKLAKEKLDYVYVGNAFIENAHDTHCPECLNSIVQRRGYSIKFTGLDKSGHCANCGYQIFNYF
ncbi:MAG: AmmeMemoRadiSam system radical SAM enzyme [Bacteroidales bacterium]|nr:AmmeMemoRadiSam system radical SAM enzyme [Bacteroidales bacterium]